MGNLDEFGSQFFATVKSLLLRLFHNDSDNTPVSFCFIIIDKTDCKILLLLLLCSGINYTHKHVIPSTRFACGNGVYYVLIH